MTSVEPFTPFVRSGSLAPLPSSVHEDAPEDAKAFETANAVHAAMMNRFTFNRPTNLAAAVQNIKADVESALAPSSPSCRRRSIVEDKPSEFRLATPQSPLYQRRKSSLLKPGSPANLTSSSLQYISSPTLSPLSTRKVSYYHPDDTDMGVCPSPLIHMEGGKPQADDVVGSKMSPFLQSTHLAAKQGGGYKL